MNKETKKIISRFLMCSVVLTCLLCLAAGSVTAKQRSEYNTSFTPYAVMTLKNADSTISLEVDEKAYSFDFSKPGKLKKYRNYLYFTPISAVVFFFESFFDFLGTFNE